VPVPSPAQVAEAFSDPLAVGPWFALPDAGAGRWQGARALYDDDLELGALVDRVGFRLRSRELRVAASVLHQGWAARLLSLGLAMVTRRGLVADLSGVQWRDDAGSVLVRLPSPAVRPGGAAEVLDQVLAEHLDPLAAGLRRLGPLAEGLLRGNTASALLSAARLADGAPWGPAGDLARDLAQDPRLAGGVVEEPGGWRRRSCCLFYRAPGNGLCGDCVLDRPPRRR